MATIASARIDENGNVHGGKAGDQTGQEVKFIFFLFVKCGSEWLLNNKFRFKEKADTINGFQNLYSYFLTWLWMRTKTVQASRLMMG